MAQTYRQLLNSVLNAAGGGATAITGAVGGTSVTDTYQLQVAEFLNQIIDECSGACQWRSRWVTYTVNYPANVTSQPLVNSIVGNQATQGPAGTTGTVIIKGTPTAGITTGGVSISSDEANVVAAINAIKGTTGVSATLSSNNQIVLTAAVDVSFTVAYGAGTNVTAAITGLAAGTYVCTAPNSNCSMIHMMNPQVGYPVAMCFDITSVGIPFPLKEIPIADLQYMNAITSTTPVQYSTHFAVQDAGNDNVNLLVYPASSTPRLIQVTLHNPMPRFDPTAAGTSTDLQGVVAGQLDAPITIPYRPLLIGTMWQLLEERGEELGLNSQYTEEKYRDALADAVSRDTDEAGGLIMLAD